VKPGTNNNNISLSVRYSDEGWYEFNIANNGLYDIFMDEKRTPAKSSMRPCEVFEQDQVRKT